MLDVGVPPDRRAKPNGVVLPADGFPEEASVGPVLQPLDGLSKLYVPAAEGWGIHVQVHARALLPSDGQHAPPQCLLKELCDVCRS